MLCVFNVSLPGPRDMFPQWVDPHWQPFPFSIPGPFPIPVAGAPRPEQHLASLSALPQIPVSLSLRSIGCAGAPAALGRIHLSMFSSFEALQNKENRTTFLTAEICTMFESFSCKLAFHIIWIDGNHVSLFAVCFSLFLSLKVRGQGKEWPLFFSFPFAGMSTDLSNWGALLWGRLI